jgi:hypothetical protein
MTIFFRLLESEDKGAALHQAIGKLTTEAPDANTFAVEPASFQQVPGSPFAYWVSESIRESFANLAPLEGSVRQVKQGTATAEDFRFIRMTWERTPSGFQGFIPFAKGGIFSKFYADIHLKVNWRNFGKEIASFSRAYIRNPDFYFRPGLTYPLRTTSGLSVRVMPQGCVFGHKGPAIFVEDDEHEELLALLALTNSAAFQIFVAVQLAAADTAARSYEVGVIQRTPVPDLTPKSTNTLATLAHRAWLLKRSLDTITQTSHAFVLPALLQVNGSSLSARATAWTDEKVTPIETELTQIQTQIDEIVFDLYGITQNDRVVVDPQPIAVAESEPEAEEEETAIAADLPTLTRDLLAYLLSVAIGRFDVRLATGDRSFPPEPAPFDPLPICSPGMLVDETGLPPTEARSLPANYAIDIPFNGILVDDEGHPNDIIHHIREVLTVIWGEKDSDIEQEACGILNVNSLRDYFRKPAAFFNDHLSRYSKSRRQAPLYLPLSTRSGSYTLWLYYHRLTDQTLYTCINDYLEPKLSRTSETVTSLRSKPDRSRNEEKTLEDLQTLETELLELRDELLRVAQLPWKPNLNDGVQITVAPLYSLFRLSKWQKKLKETWDKLEKGDYDWAHLSHTIWTARVRQKCRTDKSLAIAHNLENLYEPPPETPKRTKRKKKE